jgi:hypothetical protein
MSYTVNGAAANAVINLKVNITTKNGYAGKLNTIKVFLLCSNYSNHIDANGKITVPLPSSVIKELFGWLSSNTDLPKRVRKGQSSSIPSSSSSRPLEDVHEDDDGIDEGEIGPVNIFTSTAGNDVIAKDQITISHSCMGGYKSALKWHYEENGVLFPTDIDKWCDSFIIGYKKLIADKKERGIMKLKEGKSPLSFSGLILMCTTMVTMLPTRNKFTYGELLFGWAYILLCWNVMSRSHNVGQLMLQHMEWKNTGKIQE